MTQLGFGKTSALERFDPYPEPMKTVGIESQNVFNKTNGENKTIAVGGTVKEISENSRITVPSLNVRRTWARFCRWITSTNNRMYIGWFGVIAIPTLSTAAIVFLLAIIAAPAVDMEGTGQLISGSLLDGNNLISAAVVPTSAAIGLHFYPIWEAASVDEWLMNGGPYQLIVLHFIIGIISYQDREWELSYRLGMRPWISLAFTAPVAATASVLLVYPVGQGSFSSGMPLGISGTFTFMMQFQADHNILFNPLHQIGVVGVLGGALLCSVHGALVTSSLIRQPKSCPDNPKVGKTETQSAYRFGQAQAYQQKLFWRGIQFNSSRAVHFFLAAVPVAGIWTAALGVDMAAFDFDQFSFNPMSGSVIRKTSVPTWSDVVDQANFGIHAVTQVERPLFPLLLKDADSQAVRPEIAWVDRDSGMSQSSK
ncbi:MAG: photosystem II q(b) protein [Cyanobacteria bacterium J06576_12]